MSNVWERNQLLLDQLEQLVGRLSAGEPMEPAEVDEQMLRLLTGVIMMVG